MAPGSAKSSPKRGAFDERSMPDDGPLGTMAAPRGGEERVMAQSDHSRSATAESKIARKVPFLPAFNPLVVMTAHSALLGKFTELAFDEAAEARWQESRPMPHQAARCAIST